MSETRLIDVCTKPQDWWTTSFGDVAGPVYHLAFIQSPLDPLPLYNNYSI